MSNGNEDRRADHATAPNGHALGAFPAIETTPMTHDEFSTVFDRHFDRVYSYVRKRVGIEPICERVVREVLATHLHLVVHCVDQKFVARRLKAASDRLITAEVASAENPGLETLTAAVDRLTRAGYPESFRVRDDKLFALDGKQLYAPEELIVSSEPDSDPGGPSHAADILCRVRGAQ